MQLQLVKDADPAFPMTGVFAMLLTARRRGRWQLAGLQRGPAWDMVGNGNQLPQTSQTCGASIEGLFGRVRLSRGIFYARCFDCEISAFPRTAQYPRRIR